MDGDAALWWRAFNELQADRPIGMGGAGGIPFTATDAWARRNGIEGDDFDWLMAALASLMELQFAHETRQREAARAASKKG